MKKILKKFIKSFLLKKLDEYRMRKKYGSLYDPEYDKPYHRDEIYRKPKYFKPKKKKKDFRYMVKKIFD